MEISYSIAVIKKNLFIFVLKKTVKTRGVSQRPVFIHSIVPKTLVSKWNEINGEEYLKYRLFLYIILKLRTIISCGFRRAMFRKSSRCT